jgi:predicted acetyltransferase
MTAVSEFLAEGRPPSWNPDMMEAHFDEYVQMLLDKEHDPIAGLARETRLWSVLGEEFIGRVDIRHSLVGNLMWYGGHIGYDIRPSVRRKGYGTQQLALALPYARALGIERALITCDDDNLGSIRIIEANGGILDNKVDNGRNVLTRRYWVETVGK